MNIHFLIPGNINTLAGVYIYEKQIAHGLKAKGHSVKIHRLDDGFPFASEENKEQGRKILSLIPEKETVVIDGQILPAIADLVKIFSLTRSLVGLIHVPMSLNPLFTAYQRELVHDSEREAYAYLPTIIASSVYTRDLLEGMLTETANINVVIPGVMDYPRKTGYEVKPTRLLSISNFIRHKDHTVLVRALSALKGKNWILDCFGDLDHDRDYLADLQALIRRLGLNDKIFIHAPLSGKELSDAYLKADLFVHPSGFETYGMVLAEALSHGLPVVASTGGGILQTVPAAMAKFFKPGDVYGLITILELLLENTSIYEKLCKESSCYYLNAQSWGKSVAQFEEILISTKCQK